MRNKWIPGSNVRGRIQVHGTLINGKLLHVLVLDCVEQGLERKGQRVFRLTRTGFLERQMASAGP